MVAAMHVTRTPTSRSTVTSIWLSDTNRHTAVTASRTSSLPSDMTFIAIRSGST